MSSTGKTFKLRLTMLSDWHVGTGAGRPGSVDKLIARDADGFPFVPAKTLNGIWRDALETLTLGLDNGSEGNWSKFVELIFGVQPNQISASELAKRLVNDEKTYSDSLLSIQPARLNEALRDKINSFAKTNGTDEENRFGKIQKRKYLTALTFIKPGVAIAEETGTARPDYLRFEEMGRSGTVLETNCKLNYCDDTIQALLVASAKLVERIGGKRRRGAGRCELSLWDENEELPLTQAIQHLQSFKEEAPDVPAFPPKETLDVDLAVDLAVATSKDEWQRLEFSLTLQTPVSIVTATLGNVSESLDFIPGTYLLPHFTKALGKQIFKAVAYGDFQVSPATIQINGERGLPVPKVLGLKKVGGSFETQGTAFNKFKDEYLHTEQIKNLREGYIGNFCFTLDGSGQLPTYKKTRKTLLMHNVVQDDLQRPTEEVGGVFSREAIAAGTILLGEIRLKKGVADKLGANWYKNISGDVRLGTSKKDDYGLAHLKILSEPKAIDSQLPFYPNELTVYLLSDALLRNSNLRQANLVGSLADAICQKLNNGITDESQKVHLESTASLIQTRRIESWHEGWGFPRPTLIAMAAGSCVVFEIKKTASLSDGRKTELEKALHGLEAEGIGERRGEGYGQILFNPPLLTQQINSWRPADTPNKEQPPETSNGPLLVNAFVEQIEETVWREELKIAVLKIAADKDKRNEIFGFDLEEGKPPMSQVGGLRSVISRLHRAEDKELILSWLKHLKGTENRLKTWAKDNKQKATNKIEKLIGIIKDEDAELNVWELLGESWNEPRKLTQRDLKKDLWAEAMRALFDACARGYKRDLEKKESGDGTKN